MVEDRFEVEVPTPTTVADLMAALDTINAVDARTKRNPPLRPATVLRRALRIVPQLYIAVLDDEGASRVTHPSHVGAFAALLVALEKKCDPGDRPAWFARLTECSQLVISDDHDRAAAFLGEVLEQLFLSATFDILGAVFEWDAVPPEIERARADWVQAVREGYAPASLDAAMNASSYSKILDARPDLAGACELALTAERWARPHFADDDLELLSLQLDAVLAADQAGRERIAVDLAEEWTLIERLANHPKADAEMHITLRCVLASAERELERHDEAIAHAEVALWETECAYGPGHEETIDALSMLGACRFAGGDFEGALRAANWAHELVRPIIVERPVQAAHVAFGFALCLHANGHNSKAATIARVAARRADLALGPHNEQTQALWGLTQD